MIDPQWTPDSCASASSNEAPCGFAPRASALMDAALPQGPPGGTADTFTAVCVVPFAAPLHAASRQSSGLPSPGKNGPLAPFTISVVPQTAASPRVNGAAQLAAASGVLPLWVGPLHVLDVSTHAARTAGESYAVRLLFALLVSSDASTGGGATPCGEQDDADRALGPAEHPLIVAAAAADDEWTAMAEAWKGGEGCGAEAEGGCEWDQVAADVKAQAQQLLRDCGLTGVALTIPGSPSHRHERAQQIIAAAHHQWCSLSPAPLPPPPSARLPFPHRAAHPPAVSPRSPLTPCPENGSDGGSKAGGWEGFKSGNAQGRSRMSGRAARTLLLAACCAGLDARHLRTHSLAADPLDSAAADQPSPLSAVPSALPSPCAVSPPPVLQAPGSFRRPPGCSIEVPPSPAAEPERASPGRRLRKLLSPVYSLGGSWFAVPRFSSATAPPLGHSASSMTNRGCVGRASGAELRGRDEDWGNEDREEKEGGEEERRERVEGGDGGDAPGSACGEETSEGEGGKIGEEEEEEEGEGEGEGGRELARSQTMRSLQRSASRRGQAGGAKGAGQRRARAAARAGKGGAKVSAGLAMARSTSFRVYIETGKGPAGGKGREEDGGEGGRLSRQNSAVGRKAAQEERGVRYVRQASQRERGEEAQRREDENEERREQNGGAEGEEEEEPGSFRRAYSAPNGERSLERSKSMRRAQEGSETGAGSGRREDNAGGAVSGAGAGAGGRVRGSERGEERNDDRREREEQRELQRSRTLPSRAAASLAARTGGGRDQAADQMKGGGDAERGLVIERSPRRFQQLSIATMKAWSWQDSLRQAATIRTLPHAWKEHLLPQQQLDALAGSSAASVEYLLNACNSSSAFSPRLAPLDGAACASLPALEPLPRGAGLLSIRENSDRSSPASSFRLSAAHCENPVDAEAELMQTGEAQKGQGCEWEGEWREEDEVMSPRSSTGSCCDPDDLDSLLEVPHAFGQHAWESEFRTQSSHSRSSSCNLALPPRHLPSASCDSRLAAELLESASSSLAANPHFQLSTQCVFDGERIPELVLWLLQRGSGHEDDMMAQLQQIAAVLEELEAREGVVHGERGSGVEVDEQLSNAIRQVLLMQAAC
ncbi:unnamed protein product [Closterium sp. Yama58-4]|nr:unnamed protein product [Closterium sp. Yama58-4]